jgi:hypothetical protein
MVNLIWGYMLQDYYTLNKHIHMYTPILFIRIVIVKTKLFMSKYIAIKFNNA